MATTVRVTRLYAETESGMGESGLTEKQREAVRLAYQQGYFEIPRQVTLEDVAADLDITPQATSRRIRAAVNSLVGTEMESRTDTAAASA